MHIRSYVPSDQAEVTKIAQETFGPFYEQSFRSMVPAEVFTHQHGDWADDFRRQIPTLNDPAHGQHVAVAEADGAPLGFIAWSIDVQRHHGEIEMLAVREARRRSGIGRALCEHALTHMRAATVLVVEVGTGGDGFHEPARRLYESLGFSPIPVTYYLRSIA
ncbi:MAG TPA: GNAT family N-acetyltransferase [Jatrophihabitantaceae bacterium]|jgi:ribosomal protein S18 acetylase RimI-like enzyme